MRPELPPSRWWTIDPATGLPTDDPPTADHPSRPCLGDDALDAAGAVATDIDATFGASRYFSDEEARRLINERQPPAPVFPHPEASAELLQSVDDLWKWVENI